MKKVFIFAVIASSMTVAGCTATGSGVSANSLLTQQDSAVPFEQLAADVEASATKEASASECQTLRTNYQTALANIDQGDNPSALSSMLGGVNGLSSSTRNTAGSVGRIGNRVGVNTSGAARGISNGLGAVKDATLLANDIAAVGSLFGLGSNNKSPQEEIDDLDREALKAAMTAGCPMATFG